MASRLHRAGVTGARRLGPVLAAGPPGGRARSAGDGDCLRRPTRAATAAFHDLATAEAAGYAAD